MEISTNSGQTVLLAEVSGSARLHEKLGAGEAQWAVERCVKRMERSIEACGGRVAKLLGSELMAIFQSADAAAQAATDMQQRIADLPPVSGLKLEIRVAFSQGPVNDNGGEWSGSALRLAAHLAGLAEPGEILTDSTSHAALSSAWLKRSHERGAFSTQSPFSPQRILAISPHRPVPSVADPACREVLARLAPTTRLLLRYEGKEVLIDDSHSALRIGRDADNEVLLHGSRVSRHHALIEKRGDRFLLVDTSTNGSYLTPDGLPEVLVRHKECLIQGKGVISFATRPAAVDADCMEYEVLC